MKHFRTTLNNLSILLAGVTLLGGGMVTVAQATEVTEALVREAVTAHVQDKIQTLVSADDRKYVSVQVIKVPAAPFHFPQAKTAADVKITAESPLSDTYSDRSIIRVRLEAPNGESREIGVPVQLVIKKPVWIVKNIVNANQPLRASDFSLQTKDVSHSYSYVVGTERNLNDYIARVNLRPGEVLDARKVIIPPAVSYNDPVTILMTNESGMTITVPGIALANGRVGETIRVRQAVYQRNYYSAKVIDKNQVLVEI